MIAETLELHRREQLRLAGALTANDDSRTARLATGLYRAARGLGGRLSDLVICVAPVTTAAHLLAWVPPAKPRPRKRTAP
jgi:hypothetical protein